MLEVVSLSAVEILDSRARPTLEVTVELSAGPGSRRRTSGASTGSMEARELRDGDPTRSRATAFTKRSNT